MHIFKFRITLFNFLAALFLTCIAMQLEVVPTESKTETVLRGGCVGCCKPYYRRSCGYLDSCYFSRPSYYSRYYYRPYYYPYYYYRVYNYYYGPYWYYHW